MKKLFLFIGTVVFGLVVTVKTAINGNFSTESIHEWVLNALLVAAIVGFILVKYLKSKGKLR
ncbi:MAG: hypothetical protein LBM56_06050 [Burkholderiaceae bacterium]|jgi:uncharacterized membrane protein YdcZ (DUF606 family)|nr:hypothetical protein [Burkholderiaceae bacterium]